MTIGIGVLALAVAGQVGDASRPRPEDVYCGSYSLFVALKALGVGPDSLERLERVLGEPGQAGYSMLQLEQAARSFGARTITVATSLDNLAWRPERFACLTVINDHHYVLLYKVADGTVSLCDAPRLTELPRETFESVWTREALLIGPRDFLPEESINARRAWYRRGQVALATLALGAVALVAWRAGRSWLRRRTLAAASLLIAAGLAGAGCGHGSAIDEVASPTAPDGLTPSLVVEPALQDLGLVAVTRPNQTVRARATLRNVGGEPITIRALVPSCACSDVKLDRTTIEPGGSVGLLATIKLTNNDDDGATRVLIHSTDPVAPVIEAGFTWNARSALHADRRSINLPSIRPGRGSRREVPIYLDHLGLCRACAIEASDDLPGLECRYEPLVASPSESHERLGLQGEEPIGRLVVEVKPSDGHGHRRGTASLSLRCGGEHRALLTLPVTWRVEPAIAARPERLFLSRHGRDDRIARGFIVSSTEGREFTILDIACSMPEALASADYGRHAAMSHAIEIEVLPPQADGPWSAEVIIRTDDEDAPRVAVPMAGLVDSGTSG